MRRLLFILAILLLSVWIGIHVMQPESFVLLVYRNLSIEMPLWVALLAVFILLLLVYSLQHTWQWFYLLGYRFKNYWRFRSEHRAYSRTRHGTVLMLEGQFKKAERVVLGALHQETEPFMNYLIAASAAMKSGDLSGAETHLECAAKVCLESELAVGLLKARWQLQEKRYEQARITLDFLQERYPKNAELLRLQQQLLIAVGDFAELEALVPRLRKSQVLNKMEAKALAAGAAERQLQSTSYSGTAELQAHYQSWSREIRSDPLVVTAYVERLLNLNEWALAETAIRQSLKSVWNAKLVLWYGEIPLKDVQKQYVIVGAWLKQYGAKPETYLTLARLCRQGQLWGKAKDYYEKCLELNDASTRCVAALELGRLFESLGEAERGREVFERGLRASV